MSVDRSRHLAAEDARNELARARREADARRLLHERWRRRIVPLMNTSSEPSGDFEGCTD